MPSSWNRHPRYLLLIALVISATVYLLIPSQPLVSSDSFASLIRDTSLPARLQRAERVYQNVVSDRKDMIRKYGPTSRHIHMFPPDKDPWPAYTTWSFFPPAFDCPHEMERIGALGDGGKWTCGLSRLERKPDCIIYTFGMYYETSFEAEMLERTQHCQVWGYDYRSNSFGSSKLNNYRAHFFPYGLAHVDAHSPHDEQKLYTLKTLMEMNKHTHIDILKVDVEGWEFEVLAQILQPYITSGEPLPFGQLLIEIHTWEKKFEEFLSWWEALEAAGLRPFMTEVNLVYQNYNRGKSTDLAEYSFINVKGSNIFISDPPTAPTGTTDGNE
ncbi:methyltransferase domain-containing protein [Pisolithus orientalis]|uniref:methyltransferase domain-containing protein n=1 Tax=Pisolithus orientalis TaxID=936130 RepID=UPI002224714D|nr:methyltransferase domain-containing protein [Pisolithus orientalis]KAI5989787.1 methyltransferase domain-containing protein [Pisolithus orientalis]